jgi:hypothetical protein
MIDENINLNYDFSFDFKIDFYKTIKGNSNKIT